MARKKRVALSKSELENFDVKISIWKLSRKYRKGILEVREKPKKYRVIVIPSKKEVLKACAEIEEELGYEAE